MHFPHSGFVRNLRTLYVYTPLILNAVTNYLLATLPLDFWGASFWANILPQHWMMCSYGVAAYG